MERAGEKASTSLANRTLAPSPPPSRFAAKLLAASYKNALLLRTTTSSASPLKSITKGNDRSSIQDEIATPVPCHRLAFFV